MTLLKGTTAVSYQASRNCTASKVIISNEAFQFNLSNIVFIPIATYQILVQWKGLILYQNMTKKYHILPWGKERMLSFNSIFYQCLVTEMFYLRKSGYAVSVQSNVRYLHVTLGANHLKHN